MNIYDFLMYKSLPEWLSESCPEVGFDIPKGTAVFGA